MKIIKAGIEAHSIGLKQGGNERYIEGLIKGLSEIETDKFSFTLFLNQLADVPDYIKNNRKFHIERVSVSPVKRLFIDISLKSKFLGLDILHTQYHLPFFSNIPSVITLHDVSYITHPEFFPLTQRLKMRFLMPISIRKAKKIITVSNFSKNEILNLYKNIENKVCVIYNGVSEEFKPLDSSTVETFLKKHGITKPYILTVSNLQPRKNLTGLLRAFFTILNQENNFPCSLVIAGKKLWLYDEIFSEIRSSAFKNKVILTDYLQDNELVALYSSAEIFVYVSFYEGFGLPALEAMACGCPVIISEKSSMVEVVENAGIFVNPNNTNEISSAIKKLYFDKTLRTQMKQKAIKQAKKFSWTKCAAETLKIYKSIVSLV